MIIRIIVLGFTVLALFACDKNKDNNDWEALKGKWTLKSQIDSFPWGSQWQYFRFSHPQYLEFSSEGKVYSNGITTPTWIFEPYRGAASYNLQGNIINIGDSVNNNGIITYITVRSQFKILNISSNLLVMQHLNPNPIYTIGSLVK